ncbi:MAG: glycogen synthase GlgA [Spirochaetales bacterium]|nr:glycogen synthase GlgA [Spirochaetales bacterium]
MRILMVSSEVAPWAKAGGLADAVGALSEALARAGHELKVVMPRYYRVDRGALEDTGLRVGAGFGEPDAVVYSALLEDSGGTLYLLDREDLYGRDGIYGVPGETDFRDNPLRYAFLCRGALELCRLLEWEPDVAHAHDWPTALMAVLVAEARAAELPFFHKTASVLSIHNLGYQGVYPAADFGRLGLAPDRFDQAGFEHYGRLNLLKAGLTMADALSTVSPTYAREIQTADFGFGLDGLLRWRSADLVGILNGVDLGDWNPATDPHIAARYDATDLTGKAACKAALQREFGLPENPDVPLVAMISRLADQKGIGELFGPMYGAAWPLCSEMDLQFAVLGSGEAWCERELANLSARLPNFKARVGMDERLAHVVEAGADFFLMPSRYEPCGLSQLYSLRYGTLPVVRRTGGLADTVENYEQATGEGTGFVFDDLTPRAIYDTVGWAVWAWYNKGEHIEAMRRRAMGRVFSWDRAATEYLELYKRAIARARGEPIEENE